MIHHCCSYSEGIKWMPTQNVVWMSRQMTPQIYQEGKKNYFSYNDLRWRERIPQVDLIMAWKRKKAWPAVYMVVRRQGEGCSMWCELPVDTKGENNQTPLTDLLRCGTQGKESEGRLKSYQQPDMKNQVRIYNITILGFFLFI